jgi:predicted O-methyltransferase YrrM
MGTHETLRREAMNQDQWNAVDEYINRLVVRPDAALDAALAAGAAAGMPAISVAPSHGKLLHLLATIRGARNILEIGTLAGYSTIWLARALPPGGRVVTLEMDARHADVARANFAIAGLSDVIDLRVGRALDTLPQLAEEKVGPFDLTFIDADKVSIPEYFAWALRLSHVGSVIVVDNVIREGAVIDAASTDPAVVGVRRLNDILAIEQRVSATTIQTVGSKKYDGFTLAVVVA